MTRTNASHLETFDPLAPLQIRLDDDEAIAYAEVVEETPEALADVRLADALLAAIFRAPAFRLLLRWPDGSLGFAWLAGGDRIGSTVTSAYITARASLESLHLQHTPPTSSAWTN